MKAYCLFILSALSLQGCLLFLEDPADFPEAPTDAECVHDAELPDDWSFKSEHADSGVDDD